MDYYILYITGWLQKPEFHAATGLPRGASKAIFRMFFRSTKDTAERGESVYRPECFYLENKNEKGKIVKKRIASVHSRHWQFTAVVLEKEEDAILAKMTFVGGGFDGFCFNSKYPSLLGSGWIIQRRSSNSNYKPDHVSICSYKVSEQTFNETFFLLAKSTVISLTIDYSDCVASIYGSSSSKGHGKLVGAGTLLRTQSVLANAHTDLLNERASIERRLCDILTEVHPSFS